MKKNKENVVRIIVLLLLISSCSQERILQLNSIPSNTPEGSSVYITGAFNNWNPADSNYKLTYDATLKSYSFLLPEELKHTTYKYSRGTYETIETDKCGNDFPLRLIGLSSFIVDTVAGWMDLEHPNCPQITFVVQAKGGKTTIRDSFYLATESNLWLDNNPAYLFRYTLNGAYCLTILRPKEKLFFTVFKNGQKQYTEPQQLLGNNDTIVLSFTTANQQAEPVKNTEKLEENSKPSEPVLQNQKTTIVASVPEKRMQSQAIPLSAKSLDPPTAKVIPPKPKQQLEPSAGVVPKPVIKPETITEAEAKKKVIIIVDKTPAYGKEDNLYLAGDFNNWDFANPDFQFRNLPSGRKFLMLRLKDFKQHEFKITRGEEGTEEADYNEDAVDIHKIKKGASDDTIHIRIDSWMDAYPRSRLVFYLIDVPENTPENDDIYLTGNFNKWKTKQEKYKFSSLGNNRYALEIKDYGKIFTEYKITRGSMESEAVARNGRVPNGQPFEFIKRDTIRLRIERWKDLKD